MDSHNQTHNDIKPQNYLIKFQNGGKGICHQIKTFFSSNICSWGVNSMSGIEIVLTDFGLAGSESKGGTPIFASPECLADPDRKDKSTDIFSLGRVFLFMMLPKEKFLEFLYVSLVKGGKEKIMELIKREPILNLILKMIRIKKRINIQNIREELDVIHRIRNLQNISAISEQIQKSTSEYTIQIIDNLKHFS